MTTSQDDCLTRDAFDAVAADYAQLLPDLRAEAPLDRAALGAFVEMVDARGDGLVAEVGCGSGRITAHLAAAGLRMVGLDLSAGMVREARAARSNIPLAVAHAAHLPLRTGSLDGLVAWYSIINLDTDRLPSVFDEFARAVRPGAPIVVAFQAGAGERLDRTSAYGHAVPITYYLHSIEAVTEALAAAGFTLDATVKREASQAHETTPQAFLLARR